MKRNSSLYPLYFHLTLFTDYGPLKYLFFTLCLLIYLTIIIANVVIILAVGLKKSLHQPMYIFICCLSCNSLYGSVGFFPRLLLDIVSDTHIISRSACFIQIYFINSYLSNELTLLTVMAYDRFVAICQPLHYHSKMTLRRVKLLVFISVFYSAVLICGLILNLNSLTLCGNNVNRIFCTGLALAQLSCMAITARNIMGHMVVSITVLFPLCVVFYTYLRILLVCMRSSSEVRGKAFQTCLPHIVTFVNYCISVLCEFSLTRYNLDEANIIVTVALSLEYLIIPPINNPLVYGLSLPQIRGVIFRHLKISQKVRPVK